MHQLAAGGITGFLHLRDLVSNGLGYRAVLRRDMSAFSPEVDLRLPNSVARKMCLWYLLRSLRCNNLAGAQEVEDIHGELLNHLRSTATPATAVPVPRISYDQIDAPKFLSEYVVNPTPVVVTNMPAEAFQSWSLQSFVEAFGDTDVLYTADGGHFSAPLRHVLDANSAYVQNCESILRAHPELIAELDTSHLAHLTEGRVFGAQLFIGNTFGSGTYYHCASMLNVYYMIQGRKRWTIVDPNYSYLMYPIFTRFSAYVGSCMGHASDVDLDLFPLYAYCPRYEVELEEGDILFNPSWWWHSIKNTTEATLAVSTRWGTRADDRTNQVFTFGRLTNPRYVNLRYHYVLDHLRSKRPILAPLMDEWTFFEHASHDDEFATVHDGSCLAYFRPSLCVQPATCAETP